MKKQRNIFKVKQQDNTSGKAFNKMKINDLYDKESK